jgi:hypothetical protein
MVDARKRRKDTGMNVNIEEWEAAIKKTAENNTPPDGYVSMGEIAEMLSIPIHEAKMHVGDMLKSGSVVRSEKRYKSKVNGHDVWYYKLA